MEIYTLLMSLIEENGGAMVGNLEFLLRTRILSTLNDVYAEFRRGQKSLNARKRYKVERIRFVQM